MDLLKQLDRLRYVFTQPRNFLRLALALGSNRFQEATHHLGQPRVKCNLCGWQGRRFHHFLERSYVTYNVQCPGCGSLVRNRELVEYLDRSLSLSDQWVLEISPVPSYRQWFETRGGRYLSIDLGPRPAMARMDARRMAFPDRSFDLVICSHVLEHVPDYTAALSEIRRVLKENGRALVDVPFSRRRESLRLARPDHLGHYHDFGSDVIERIEETGFRVKVELYSAARDREDPANQFFVLSGKPLAKEPA